MALVEVGGRDTTYVSWPKTEPGTVFKGFYNGPSTNKFDPTKVNFELVNQEGKSFFLPETSILKNRIETYVNLGDWVHVTFEGKKAGKSGNSFNAFKIEVDYDIVRPNGEAGAGHKKALPF